jgi:transaldolase / glucose-6-phosphate isomerase
MEGCMNPLQALNEHGQAVWLDFLARDFLRKGGLRQLIAQDGLSGVTSNPSIFEKAIGESSEYEDKLRAAAASGGETISSIYEGLAIEDIRHAADDLKTVFDRTKGADGFVSLEVSPYLANDTAATIAEAQRLWHAVDRPNLMVKVPATPAGLPAIRQLIGEGININITLLFSQKVYEEVAEAYLAGLEHFAANGGNVGRIASVASFFVSRIDTAVDAKLTKAAAAASDSGQRKKLEALRGKTAIANAKLAYRSFKRIFAGPRWDRLAAKGARVQRLLWASTGTKDPAYSDVLYVETLIGPHTVNTMPVKTMDAFRDHGRARATIEEGVGEAEADLAAVAAAGISLDEVTASLVVDGVQLFADAFDKLLGAVARKRAEALGTKLSAQKLMLGDALGKDVDAAAEAWRSAGNVRRLWGRDAKLWTGHDEAKWLGWLDVVDAELADIGKLKAFAEDVRAAKFRDAVLLGMGGSSLGPEVLALTFGSKPGFPKLLVLDSTDPQQVRAIEESIDLAATLFIVSSKSGGTLEPNIFKDYFFARVLETVGKAEAGGRFVAVTDPNSSLQKTAERDGFRHIFFGNPSIGGRYSVLSKFGLVPAAAIGLDVGKFLDSARVMVRSCGDDVPPAANPAVQLGLAMGRAAAEGRDKVTIITSPEVADFGAWAEQLIAESTGKNGKGLIPVDGEPLGAPSVYGNDRLFIQLRLRGSNASQDAIQDAAVDALANSGHPVVRIDLHNTMEIAQEFFRWEMATAVVGAVIGIDPFDQPDVEASKVATRDLTAGFEKTGALPAETPVFRGNDIAIYTDETNAQALRRAGANSSLDSWLKAHLSRIKPGDYAAFLAYIERNKPHIDALQGMRTTLRDDLHVATCVGFGPRFLHSTGQAYKGGPPSGVFLQITADDAADLPIPGHRATFGVVKAAQARGDFQVLAERGRRALRVHLGRDVEAGLSVLAEATRRALS